MRTERRAPTSMVGSGITPIVINNGRKSAQPQCLVQVSLVRYPFGPIVPAGHSRRMRPDCLSNLYTWVR